MLRVANPGEPKSSFPVSTTVWRHDLPLALYGPVGTSPSDTAGIILTAGRSHPLCAYPVDANTIQRTSSNNASVKDVCGVSPSIWLGGLNGGECKFKIAEEYVSAYYFKPIVSLYDIMTLWTLESATCHFTNVPLMLDAQKLLLQRSMHTPPGTTDKDWLSNATKLGYGLTAFNEVQIAPYEESAVGGIFWAHPGPFRSPHAQEYGACHVANYLKKLSPSAATPPIFELADVNLERPFLGCIVGGGYPIVMAPDCLSRGLGEWQSNMTDAGGYGSDSSNVFRLVDASAFKSLSCTHGEEDVAFV